MMLFKDRLRGYDFKNWSLNFGTDNKIVQKWLNEMVSNLFVKEYY